ncbi:MULTISPECIES: hypothetical protein [Pontibacillus]|uniref:WYL domain-containing protein n=1 Tax=Pontibacillus chungwhensis TaxID=265426 RepID=A0ABY8V188_9BACI|nr:MULTISPECIES: hypothetical protein [Pontibacillus]MCD5324802.1 hypothetical protein [Pontibacillus sp. HN14]WIF98761.1 hypothetical protein QNI29_03665 [Pontibacillus chungwhensis]
MKGMLANAKKNQEVLEMIYLSKDGQLSQRNIKVLDIDDSFILGYCLNRNKLRKFKRGNILSIGPLRKKVG